MTQQQQENLDFDPFDVGDGSLPPDAPEGAWVGEFDVKKRLASETGYPQLIIECTLVQSLDGNDNAVGSRVSEFITIGPRTWNGFRVNWARLVALCSVVGVPVPAGQFTWESVEPLIKALTTEKRNVWTWNKPDTRRGGLRTNLSFVPIAG